MSDQTIIKRIRSGMWALLKLAAVGTIVFAIAFVFIAVDSPRGDVAPAEADIWAYFVSETSKHENFVRTLEDEGMSAPREYDYNGNRVFFSYDTTRERPREVMYRYQEALVRHGVNTYFHGTAREPVPLTEATDPDTMAQGYAGVTEVFTGGLIPVELQRNRMVMVGLETPQGATQFEDVVLETRLGQRAPEDIVGAFRYMDATRDERSGETTITAVWSDDDMDMRKFRPNPRARSGGTVHSIEFEVPTCPQCTRVSRLSGTEHESEYHTILYRSRDSINRLLSFYENNMEKYGWESMESMRGLAELQRRSLAPGQQGRQIRAYVRDGLHLTMIVYRDRVDGYTYVTMTTTR